jgi:hypothetical protein
MQEMIRDGCGNEHSESEGRNMPYLPRELQVKILSHLDIDGRRALGIYGKLSVPDHLQVLLKQCLPNPNMMVNEICTRIFLGPMMRSFPRYVLRRDFGTDTRQDKSDTFVNSIEGKWWYATFTVAGHKSRNIRNPIQREHVENWDLEGVKYSIVF